MRYKWLIAMVLVVVPSAFAAGMARPGTVNYIEGQVTINGRTVAPASVENGSTTLAPNQVLSVGTGKAEILLTPGTFLRVGDGGAIRLVAADLANPQVEVMRGQAMVEVDYKPKQARLDVLEQGANTQLLKEGLYKFNADQGLVQVIDGKASVTRDGRSKDIGKGKELTLLNATLKPAHFDTEAAKNDPLYRWSSVRDSYLARANEASARTVYVDGGYGPAWGLGWGTGWYWNPYYDTYAWLPGDGYFWSPFGYPFFSPGYVIYAPGFRYYGYRNFNHAGRGSNALIGRGMSTGRLGGVTAPPRVSSGTFGGTRMGGTAGTHFGGGVAGGGRMGGGRR